MKLGIILRRELRSYFATPIAYVFIVIFLVLASVFTFYLGNFYERQQADLTHRQCGIFQALPEVLGRLLLFQHHNADGHPLVLRIGRF